MGDRAGVVPQEYVYLILLDDDAPFEVRDGGRRCGQRGLSPGGFQFRDDPAFETLAENSQAFRERTRRACGNFVFPIEFQQLEPGLGHVSDKRECHSPPRFLAGKKLGASRFVQTPNASPKVQFPGSIDYPKERIASNALSRGVNISEDSVSTARSFALVADLRKKLPASLHRNSAGLFHTRQSDAQVVIIRQR